MRTIATGDSQILSASSQERGARVRVSVKDAGGTFRDLTTYPEEDFVESVSWREDVDSPGATASVALKRAVGEKSVVPLHETSPLNKGWNPATAYAALLEIGREVKIEAGVTRDLEATPDTWLEVFRGYVDTIDWAGESVQLECSDLFAKLRDTWIETERVYAHAQGASATKGCRSFEPSRAYALNELVLPSEANLNAHFYKVTTAGTTGASEPAWPTSGTVSSGTVTFTEVGATSTTVGTAVETVMQQIIDDNLGAGVVTLYTPTSPGWAIRGYQQQRESVWDAISKLADQIGWALRYRWDSGTSAFRLTLFDVNRSKTTPDATIGAGELVEVRAASKDISLIRNVVRVVYSDTANRTPGTNEPIRDVVEVSDSSSITKYGRRFCEVAESANSNIDTSTEATALANAVLSDLKEPFFEWGVTLRFYPWIEPADLLRFGANGRHFSSDQDLAVVQVSHSIEAGAGRTELGTRGKPATGKARWLSREGRARPGDVHNFQTANPGGTSTLQSSETVAGRRFIFAQDAASKSFPLHQELHIGESAGFSPSGSTLKASGPQTEVTVNDLIPGKTYYAKTIPYRRNASRLVRGLPSAEISFVAGRTRCAHYDSTSTQSHLPLNGNFEHASRDLSLEPPDHWELSPLPSEREAWGGSGSVYYGTDGTDSSKGRFIRLQADASRRGSLISSPFEVRRGIRNFNIYLSVRRNGASAATGKDLIVDVWGFSDAALTSQIINYSVTLSGDASGPYPSLATWYDTVIDFGGGYGTIPTNVNFLQLRVRRGTAGDSSFSWDIGDVYTQEADFYRAAIDGLTAGDLTATGTTSLAQPSWTAPTFNTGWTDYGLGYQAAGYVKDSLGFVHLRGMVKRTSGTGTVPFQLPSGYRPAASKVFVGWGENGGSPQAVEIVVDSSGNVTLYAAGYSYTSLEGITFDTRS